MYQYVLLYYKIYISEHNFSKFYRFSICRFLSGILIKNNNKTIISTAFFFCLFPLRSCKDFVHTSPLLSVSSSDRSHIDFFHFSFLYFVIIFFHLFNYSRFIYCSNIHYYTLKIKKFVFYFIRLIFS